MKSQLSEIEKNRTELFLAAFNSVLALYADEKAGGFYVEGNKEIVEIHTSL